MQVFSKNLLMNSKREYTLTVTTSPASATVTLTYDGVSHNETSATVDEGTVIQYSVYQSTYGTTTGSITMDRNKTLSCTGTYSTSTTDVVWNRPNLSSDGTVGGSSFACYADSEYSSYYAYKAFDGNITNAGSWISTNTTYPHYLVFYSPTPIKISNLQIYNRPSGSYVPKDYTLYGSNTGSSWTFLTSGTNTVSGGGSSWYIYPSSSSYYKYYKFEATSHISGSGYYILVCEMLINAVYQQTSYTYYWDTSIT